VSLTCGSPGERRRALGEPERFLGLLLADGEAVGEVVQREDVVAIEVDDPAVDRVRLGVAIRSGELHAEPPQRLEEGRLDLDGFLKGVDRAVAIIARAARLRLEQPLDRRFRRLQRSGRAPRAGAPRSATAARCRDRAPARRRRLSGSRARNGAHRGSPTTMVCQPTWGRAR
jgi:hypothetical protein